MPQPSYVFSVAELARSTCREPNSDSQPGGLGREIRNATGAHAKHIPTLWVAEKLQRQNPKSFIPGLRLVSSATTKPDERSGLRADYQSGAAEADTGAGPVQRDDAGGGGCDWLGNLSQTRGD